MLTRFVFVFSIVVLASSSASADLIVNIVGTPGSGQTNWTFSGNATAAGNDFFDDGALQAGDSWFNVGDLYSTPSAFSDTQFSVSGSASITTSNGTRGIDSLFLDDDPTASGDEFGVGVDGSSNLNFSSGETVSWTGSFTFAQDINAFLVGSHGSNNFGGAGTGALDLTINVSAVPEPGSAIFMITFGAATVLVRRRRVTGR